MGRELKRVPLDFEWPLGRPWEGYVNPHYEVCAECGGHGTTIACSRLYELINLLKLSASNARSGRCHPYLSDWPFDATRGKVCGADMVDLVNGLTGEDRIMFGDGSSFTIMEKIVAAAGLPEDWGTCTACGGEGIAADKFEAYEAWEPTEPPEGEGYQVWENVSEGSPISPVFATPEELARFMADDPPWETDRGTSYETWLRFINGHGCTCTLDVKFGPGGVDIKSGVEATYGEREQ